MKIDPNAPAFPAEGGNDSGLHANPGLTIRAEFAKAAMQGLCSNTVIVKDASTAAKGQDFSGVDVIAAMAVDQADSLISALNKEA